MDYDIIIACTIAFSFTAGWLVCFFCMTFNQGPPEDGFGVITDEEGMRRLNRRLQERRNRLIDNLTFN